MSRSTVNLSHKHRQRVIQYRPSVILSVVEIPASEDERQGSNGGEAERLGSRYRLMTASLCYFYLVRIALCNVISLEGYHLLGTRSQAPFGRLLPAARLRSLGVRLRIRSAQDDIQRDVRLDFEFDSSDTRMVRTEIRRCTPIYCL